MTLVSHKLCSYFIIVLLMFVCNAQDPWDLETKQQTNEVEDDKNIPPDLRITPKKRPLQTDSYGIGEWFYRRILSIVLKGGQVKENEDGSVVISLQMKLDQRQRKTLDEYLSSTSTLSEDKLRRSLGYIEQSIYEPSLPTKIILAWSDYIQMFLADYKTEITWTLGLLAALSVLYLLWMNMSHRKALIIAFIALYAYEVFISYKEAEQRDIEMFVAAVNSCKWYVWSSSCELPKPDPVVFLKHMNPLKIAIRMFTSIVSEPMIVLSDTVKIMTHGITDGLWYPFNVIMYGIMITFFNIMLVIFLITSLFNFILNIPINLNFLLFSVGLRQRNRSMFSNNASTQNEGVTTSRVDSTSAISGATLDKLLDVILRTSNEPKRSNPSQNAKLDVSHSSRRQIKQSPNSELKRSASTGRLPNSIFENYDRNITKRNIGSRIDGGGDRR
ncbi:hypothetical protein O0L34_g16383 [Tuta absoluta]|nr:hypothetical protein O0L34_g16383 [Tuta absoluta]